MGRLVEFYGEDSQGKTMLALLAIKQAQLNGGGGILINSEHTFQPSWARDLGLSLDDKAIRDGKFMYTDVSYVSEAFIAADTIIKNYIDVYPLRKKGKGGKIELVQGPPGPPFVVVVDSIANLKADSDKNIEIGDTSGPGKHARQIGDIIRGDFLNNIIGHNILVIFINHLYDKIGTIYGAKTTSFGGRNIKYNADVRLDIVRAGLIADESGVESGIRIRTKTEKCKVGIPRREVEFSVMYKGGMSDASSAWDYLKNKGAVVHRAAGRYSVPGTEDTMYEHEFISQYEASEKFRKTVKDLVNLVLQQSPILKNKTGYVKWSAPKAEEVTK